MSNLLQILEPTFTTISNSQIFCFWSHFINPRDLWHFTMTGLTLWVPLLNISINIKRDEEWFDLVRSSTSVQSTSIIWARFRLVASPASKLNVDNILIVQSILFHGCLMHSVSLTMNLITCQWAGGCCYTAMSPPTPTQPMCPMAITFVRADQEPPMLEVSGGITPRALASSNSLLVTNCSLLQLKACFTSRSDQ